MVTFELIISLLLVGAFLASLARRLKILYPVLLACFGAILVFVPNLPDLTLAPELVLALFVAPVLLDAAYDASLRDLRDNWRPVAGLALVAVGLTVVCVAYVVRWLVPDIPWPAAVALGAIVAPPDASAATTVLGQLRPPHRVLIILEGESLFNDASALLIYRAAVESPSRENWAAPSPGWCARHSPAPSSDYCWDGSTRCSLGGSSTHPRRY